MKRRFFCAAFWLAVFLPGHQLLRAQAIIPAAKPTSIPSSLPDAPQPRQTGPPCVSETTHDDSETASAGAGRVDPESADAAILLGPFDPRSGQSQQAQNQQNQNNNTRAGFPPTNPSALGRAPVPAGSLGAIPHRSAHCVPEASSPAEQFMSCDPQINMYRRFLSYSLPVALTPKQKFLLAYKNVRDPFNLLTIFGEAAISVASNAESAYGPGFPGFGKYIGVSFTEDATAEFFGTALIPSLAHQDPHYLRMPNLPIKRRIIHVIDAVVIGHGDDGLPMFNYAEVFGTIGTSALGNLYVPGRRTTWGASADRISVALATDPIGNAISEFLPDVARRININVVLVQRVINRVAIEEGGGGAQ